jgi:hypothetical protein
MGDTRKETTIVAFEFPDRYIEFCWWNGTELVAIKNIFVKAKAHLYLIIGTIKTMKANWGRI